LLAQEIQIAQLTNTVQTGVNALLSDIFAGAVTWEEAQTRLTQSETNFSSVWKAYQDQSQGKASLSSDAVTPLFTLFGELKTLVGKRDRNRMYLFFINDLSEYTTPFFTAVQELEDQVSSTAATTLATASSDNRRSLILASLVAIIGTVLTLLFSFTVYRSITKPVQQLADTVHRLSAGDYAARTNLVGADELSELGQALDRLLQERLTQLAQAERDNEGLNISVVDLLQAVSSLSQRDLTINVPVNNDITGPIADSLNLFTTETSQVLRQVSRLAAAVATSSSQVKGQADTVLGVAERERKLITNTTAALTEGALTMNQIAGLAKNSDTLAAQTSETTEAAVEGVTQTITSINQIRDTIRETEKRIKRLGERSQEISTAVNLINSIAERTHILALNASMHAASAGEAGRGFAVVANEVQRLSENAQEATSEIARLVENIQVDTSDTVITMNHAIEQVVEGTKLAQQAGDRMQQTRTNTQDLAQLVQRIATASQAQAKASNNLRQSAREIEQSTQETAQQLSSQHEQTNRLLRYSQELVAAVSVFKLPNTAP
jgi:methyl-accepting chemotaxis protein